MNRYFLRRITYGIITLFLVSFVTFTIVSLAPGDVVSYIMQYESGGVEAQQMRSALGLDRPAYIRYFRWIKELAAGNLGNSLVFKHPVKELIMGTLPYTMVVSGLALLLAIALSIVIVYSMATVKSRLWKGFLYVFSLIGASIPEFWLCYMVLSFSYINYKWMPYVGLTQNFHDLSFLDQIQFSIVPMAILTMIYLAANTRYLGGSVKEIMAQDYILTARSVGFSQRKVVMRHAMKNALIPLLTTIGITLPTLVSATIIIEMVFRFPGIGYLFIISTFSRDYPLLISLMLLVACFVIFGGLVIDFFYALADPRIKYE